MLSAESGPRRRAAPILLAVLACVVSGCAPYGLGMERVRDRLALGEPEVGAGAAGEEAPSG